MSTGTTADEAAGEVIISTFLTKEEVAQMTGRVQRAAQTRELTHMGVIRKLRADGYVLVLRAHVEQLLEYQARTKFKAGPSLLTIDLPNFL